MKHDMKITLVLLAMFFIAQLIGLVVINAYSPKVQEVEKVTDEGVVLENVTTTQELPYGMQPPSEINPGVTLASIIFSIIFATLFFLLLTKLRADILIKLWFLAVVFITLSVSLNALLSYLPFDVGYSEIALLIALPLVFYKVVKMNMVVHNLTELLVYPGLAAVFVPVLNIFWAIILLLAISLWDIYAVWHSKIMEGMAKYQINKLKVFTGFFMPYLSKENLQKIKKFKLMNAKQSSQTTKKLKNIKVSLAILGGGDVAFPIIFAGVVLRALTLTHALMISVCATFSLFLLFVLAEKKKFYPAMPFLTAGCLIGYALSLLI